MVFVHSLPHISSTKSLAELRHYVQIIIIVKGAKVSHTFVIICSKRTYRNGKKEEKKNNKNKWLSDDETDIYL